MKWLKDKTVGALAALFWYGVLMVGAMILGGVLSVLWVDS